MKISELQSLDHCPETAFGIEVDEECFSPPVGLQKIGLLWSSNDDGAISDLLIDTIISFTLSGVEVIIEISPDDIVDPAHLMLLAGNAGFSVSLIPGKIDPWMTKLDAFVEAFLTSPNFAGHLYPISGYFSYIVAERGAGAGALVPNDPYVVDRYIAPCAQDDIDASKGAMRAAFQRVLGGEEGVDAAVKGLLCAIHAEAERIIRKDIDDSAPA